ncbi:MAG: Flp pilus assembly protein CpaB [Frankiaceae bacterium]|nr:Flp pilus assembly protein CpaB [Frankiaceae bacterium]
MRARKSALLLSLVVALVGTLLVASYVKHSDASAATAETKISVLVAKARIPAGTDSKAVAAGLTQLVAMPKSTLPLDALTDLTTVESLVAVSDVFPGQVLVRAGFAPSPNSGGLTIPKGKLAVSVQLGDPQRVAGFVLPGSEVAVFDTRSVASGATGAAGAQDAVETRTLFARVTVIAVGPTALQPPPTTTKKAAEPEKAVPAAILTLAVDQGEAERLVQATQTGKLYFALLSRDSKTGSSAGVNDGTLFR